ncbi:MAG: hypothetical protein ACXWL9_08575 [Syntrophales bacterium]
MAVLACSFLANRIEVAKLYYFESDRPPVSPDGQAQVAERNGHMNGPFATVGEICALC